MHVSMFKGTKKDYVQVTCDQELYQAKLEAMGFVKTIDELKDSAPTQERKAKLTRQESK